MEMNLDFIFTIIDNVLPFLVILTILVFVYELGHYSIARYNKVKVEVFSMIDSIDQEARTIGAVNTLFHTGEEWRGFNTDGYGLEQALKGRLGVRLESANILILGAGGAARAAAAQSLSRGCENLWISNRSTERLESMIDALGNSLDTARVVAFPHAGQANFCIAFNPFDQTGLNQPESWCFPLPPLRVNPLSFPLRARDKIP